MHYSSIIRLLHHADIDTQQPERMDIVRIKKQLNAEYAMNASGILTIDEVNYNKHDVFTELEQPDFIERIRYHTIVWEHRELLELLEQDSIEIKASYEEWFYLQTDEGFVMFLSPYFAEAFNSVMKTLLNLPDFAQATTWLQFTKFLLPEEEEKAFEGLRIFLNDSIHMFRNINRDNYRSYQDQLNCWQKEPWGIFMNQLPDTLFYYIDDLGIPIINVTARLQQADGKMCLRFSNQLIKLTRISPENRSIILKNHEAFKPQNKYRITFGKAPGAFIFGAIILLKMLAGMGTCNSSSDNIESQFGYPVRYDTTPQSQNPDVKKFFDTTKTSLKIN